MLDNTGTDSDDLITDESDVVASVVAANDNDNVISKSDRLKNVLLVVEAAIGHQINSNDLKIVDGPFVIERKCAMSQLEIAEQQLDVFTLILTNRARLSSAKAEITKDFEERYDRQLLLVESFKAELALLNYLALNASSLKPDRIESLESLIDQLRFARKPTGPVKSLKPARSISLLPSAKVAASDDAAE